MYEHGLQTPGRPVLALDSHRIRLLGAFFLVYGVWGSNYLAIRYAVETVPPFLLMGARSLLAGACLYLWARLRSAERPGPADWRAAATVGAFLFLGCHGLLAWAHSGAYPLARPPSEWPPCPSG